MNDITYGIVKEKFVFRALIHSLKLRQSQLQLENQILHSLKPSHEHLHLQSPSDPCLLYTSDAADE